MEPARLAVVAYLAGVLAIILAAWLIAELFLTD